MRSSTFQKKAILAASCYVSLFLLFGSVLLRHFGFPLDDSWIHQTVARNLADTGVLGFRPGRLSAGSTSLLWTILLAVRPLLFPALSPVLYCFALSTAIMACIGYTFRRLVDEDGITGAASWCLVLAPVANGNFLWFGMIGMEHLLFLLLSICLIRAWFRRDGQHEGVRALVLPVLCFLLPLTRPEGIFLIAVLGAMRIRTARSRKGFVAAVSTLSGWAVAAFANWMTARRLTPLTMQGRGGGFDVRGQFHVRMMFLEQSGAHLLAAFGYHAPSRLTQGRWLLIGLPIMVAIAGLLIVGCRSLMARHAERFLALIVWAGTLELLYCIVLPKIGHGGRYISVTVMLFLPLMSLGVYESSSILINNKFIACVPLVTFAVWTMVGSISLWRQVTVVGIDHINQEHGAMAVWLKDNLPASAVDPPQLAAYDIGRIGYALHGNLIDLGGLVDREFMPYRRDDRVSVYLKERDVRYVIFPSPPGDDTPYATLLGLDRSHGVLLFPLHTVCGDEQVLSLPLRVTSTAFLQCQKAYTIQYEVK